MPSTATPALLTDPGFLFWAPFGSSLPTNTVAGSGFSVDPASPYVPLGATEEGSTFAHEINVEPITVAELFYPVAQRTTEINDSIAFAVADWTLDQVKRIFNGGTKTIVSGTGATQLTKYTPPTPDQIVRCMILWQSLDASVRLVCYQCINSGTIEMAFKRAPDKTLMPAEFKLEKPAATEPFDIFTAGATRGGA